MTGYKLPFPDSEIPTGGTFKDRTPPRTAFHRGTDWSYFKGARGAIGSVCNGMVINKGWSSVVGNWVEILSTEPGDLAYWTYCHMAAATPLTIGQNVRTGQTVGTVGATGSAARGAHLHLAGSPTKGGGLSAPVTNLYDPHAYIAARLAAPAGGNATPLDPTEPEEEDDMLLIRVRNSDDGSLAIAQIGGGLFHEFNDIAYEALYDGWKIWDRSKDLNVPGNIYNHLKGLAAEARGSVDVSALATAVIAKLPIGGTTDVAAIVAGVEASLADNFAAIPDAVMDEELARLKA